ncbi:MAG: class I SAM-dependent methyltransferase [Chloroflexota bacterium]|nr:class I SAM-dependent methyltransferase [Chloroflexota bacterium]
MTLHRLYNDLAWLWPVISPPEEYADESGYWRRALWGKLGEGRHRILELGSGGGHNLSHLTRHFQATAVDLSPHMLRLSTGLNLGVDHHLGDMRSVRLGQIFDAVLIHDAISYLLTEEDLKSSLETCRVHLRSGGVLLIAPDWVREDFDGATSKQFQWVRKKGRVEVTIDEHLHDPDPDDTQIESIYTYTIKEIGKERVEKDTHITGLFPIATWTRLMEAAGFRVEVTRLPPNRGGYGGVMFSGVL